MAREARVTNVGAIFQHCAKWVVGTPPRGGNGDRLSAVGWRVVLIVYFLLYGALLIATRGLPYAIDNNESFSSLWHARHLYDVSLSETKGLADEVFAWHTAASPYVHSHQGNFPRLFAFLIYLLGARSIESQIVVTTFTVGLAAIWLAYRFLCTLGPPLFAAMGCLIMMSDYGLFGQWQVDTYRVWYGFFFFSSLVWISSLGINRRWPMVWVGILNFAAMFYGEYVFAAFVGLTAAGYALIRYFRAPGTLLRAWLAVFLGGAAAASLLLFQLTAYMGWRNVKLDLGYTLAARNMASDTAFSDMVDKFYRENRVIFWHNYFDISKVRTFGSFWGSLFRKHLQFDSPWIVLSAIVILCGGAAAGFRRKSANEKAHPNGINHEAMPRRFSWTWLLPAIAPAVVAYVAFRYLRPLFDDSSSRLWNAALGLSGPAWLGPLVFSISAMFALGLAASGRGRAHSLGNRMGGLMGLSLCVFAAYAIVYRVFTGYIYSGYLDRQAPFLVFWTDTLLAGAVCLTLEAAHRGYSRSAGIRLPAVPLLVGSALLACFGMAWVTLQLSYLMVAPPTGEPFLKLLSKPPFHYGNFVLNDYPAPAAEKAHGWAYADTSIFSGRVKLGPNGFEVARDAQYLWFADAPTNAAYLKPDFGILVKQPANIPEALAAFVERQARPASPVAFASNGLVRRARDTFQPFLKYRLVATDGDAYSIVKFDWDYPPFLKPVDAAMRLAARSMTLDQKIANSEAGQEQLRHWHVVIEAAAADASAASGGGTVALTEASIDGRPIFSDREFSSAGWTKQTTPIFRGNGAWIGSPGVSAKLERFVVGGQLSIHLLEGPDRGTATVGINDMRQAVELSSASVGDREISFNTAQTHGKYSSIPNASPGMYVNTWLHNAGARPEAVVEYAYSHQENSPEEGTTFRIYHEDSPGGWDLADEITYLGARGLPVRLAEFRRRNPDTLREYARINGLGDARSYEQWLADHLAAFPNEGTRDGVVSDASPETGFNLRPGKNAGSEFRAIPLPTGLRGRLQISVTPGTRTKTGPEYFGLPFDAQSAAANWHGFDAVAFAVPAASQKADFPYGYLRLRLRFPADKMPQAEPIVSAGVEEAADFVYVIYTDSRHLRIGFDHWFSGGPITAPIAIDYAKVHDLVISMGSLFPPQEDLVFEGVDPALVASLKGEIRVTLDGKTVIKAASEFWDCPPGQVAIGRNDVKGTSENTVFNGEILSCKRVWPDLH
jgi:hypothetical protein